jgi:hypothetical protein
MLRHPSPAMKLFEITVAGRRSEVAREADGDQFYQTYYVDGRDVPVQHYLKMMPWPWGPTLVPCSTARARSGMQWLTALAPPESRPTSTARQTRAAALGRPVPAVFSAACDVRCAPPCSSVAGTARSSPLSI